MNYNPPLDLYQKISPMLQADLEYNNIELLKCQLTKLDSIRYELGYVKAQWYQKLVNERERLRMPKSSEYTEFDRKTMNDSGIASIELDYNFISSLVEITNSKIELGKVFLTK
jgi:hypothetical protein